MAVFELKHPLIEHKLSNLRNKDTDTKLFRESLNEIAGLMVYEATKHLPLKEIETETPIQKTTTKVLDKPITLVPILRAGLGMIDGILQLLPNAKVGHLGVYRNEETLEPVYYYAKMPTNVVESQVFVVDPMLATGGSMELGYKAFLTKGTPKQIHVCCVIASPEGIDHIKKTFPEDKTTIWCAAIDPGMNEHKYIVPGFGDAGDLCYGEKL